MEVALTLDFRNAPERRRPWKEFWEDGLWLLCEAEAMGFDSVTVQQHFFQPDGYGPSLPVFLTLLAERTRRVRIGSYLYILPLHNPAQGRNWDRQDRCLCRAPFCRQHRCRRRWL